MSRAAAKPRTSALFTALFTGGLGVLLGFFGVRWVAQNGSLRPLLDALGPYDLLALPLLYLMVIAIHELGHLAGGMSRGMRFLILIVGPLRFTRGADGIRFDWFWNAGTLGGLAAAVPDPEKPAEPQLRRLMLGGPLASLLLALFAALLALQLDGRPGAYAVLISAFSALIFLLTATPFRAGGFLSDGMQYLEMLRGGEAVRSRILLTALLGQSMSGVRPRDTDGEILRQVLDSPDREPLRRLSAELLAFLRNWDSGVVDAAEIHLLAIESGIDDYPDGFRQVLAIELALFAALQRGDAASARAWMQRAKGGVVDEARRELAEAATAFVEGDNSITRQALDRGLSRLRQASDSGLAVMTRDQLAALQSRLKPPSNSLNVTSTADASSSSLVGTGL